MPNANSQMDQSEWMKAVEFTLSTESKKELLKIFIYLFAYWAVPDSLVEACKIF